MHGNHPKHTSRPTRRRSSAFKPNSKRSSRYQAPPSEEKALNFIPSLSSSSPKNTGGTRARRTNSDWKRIGRGLKAVPWSHDGAVPHSNSQARPLPTMRMLSSPWLSSTLDSPRTRTFRCSKSVGIPITSTSRAATAPGMPTPLKKRPSKPSLTLRGTARGGEKITDPVTWSCAAAPSAASRRSP